MSTRKFDFISGPTTAVLPDQGILDVVKRVVKSASYVILDTDGYSVIECDTGGITITLPVAANNIDRRLLIINNSSGSVTVDGSGAELINGVSSYTLASRYDKCYIQSNGTKWLEISTQAVSTTQIIPFTTVGAVGDTGQISAGHYPNVSVSGYNDLGTTYAETIAYWKFATGALTTDEKGTYTLTNNGTATAANGILNTTYGTELNGSSQYYTHATLLDDMSIFTSGGIVFETFVNLDDGQPAAINCIFEKYNSAPASYNLYCYTTGELVFATGAVTAKSSTGTMPNGSTGWQHILCSHDTTSGLRLFLNGLLLVQNTTDVTLEANGTGADFCIGRAQSTTNQYTDGKIAYLRILNKKITQKDVDVMYATTIANTLGSTSMELISQVQIAGSTSYVKSYDVGSKIVGMDTTNLYLAGGNIKSLGVTDKIKIVGR